MLVEAKWRTSCPDCRCDWILLKLSCLSVYEGEGRMHRRKNFWGWIKQLDCFSVTERFGNVATTIITQHVHIPKALSTLKLRATVKKMERLRVAVMVA